MHGPVLASQLGSPLLILLAVTALASAFLGQASDAVIIGVILAASVGMGFFNEYKAAKTAEALARSPRPSAISRTAASIRACRVRALRRSSRPALGTPPAAATFAIVVLPSLQRSAGRLRPVPLRQRAAARRVGASALADPAARIAVSVSL
jgi:hypothetical protein